MRNIWWRLLDTWESRAIVRRTAYVSLVLAVLAAALGYWVYPRWKHRNAMQMARQWIQAGKPSYAAGEVREALESDPQDPEAWRLASRLDWLLKRKTAAVAHARKAATLGNGSPELILEWASTALRADMPDEAGRALHLLSPDQTAQSAFAQRLLGEIARREERLTDARNHFAAALRLDGPSAVDEVPLGLVLVRSQTAAERRRGLALLQKWTADPEWGAEALRVLLRDAILRDDRPAMGKWGEALRTNARCTLGDMPDCLLALSRADPGRFATVMAGMEKDYAVSPLLAAQLIGWLNQIGRSDEAVRWIKSLPAEGLKHAPLAVVVAEALRKAGDWVALRDLTDGGDWGIEANFLRLAYGMEAAHRLGDQTRFDQLWKVLYDRAGSDPVHALFAGSTIFSWGRDREAEKLWWKAADQQGRVGIQALGTLARFYQTRHDANGEFRAFESLHLRRPNDPDIANNFAYFAALLGRRLQQADTVSKENLSRAPGNRTYLATRGFVLVVQSKAAEALKLLQPHASETDRSSALAFAYGLALAAAGDKSGAARLLHALDHSELSGPEAELIKSALRDRSGGAPPKPPPEHAQPHQA